METAILKVGGMSCQGCVSSVSKILMALPGVHGVAVSLAENEARIEFESARITRDKMKEAIEAGGFEAA